MTQRAERLRKRLKIGRRIADSAQRAFLGIEDLHTDLADREARRAGRERQLEASEIEQRFPQVARRHSS